MPDPFLVGPTGLPLWRYPDWRAVLEERWRETYGAAADTRPETPDGLVIDLLALWATLQSDAAQSVWASSFFRTAEAPALDLLLDVFGRIRLAATSTTVGVVWYGDAASVVWDGVGSAPVGLVVSAGPSDGDRYTLTAATTIPAMTSATVLVYEVIRVVDGEDYGIEIDDGGGPTEQVVQAASEDPQDLVEALAAEVASTWPAFTVTTHPHRLSDRWVMVVQSPDVFTAADVAPSSTDGENAAVYPAILVDHEAEVTGPQVCLAGTLIQPATTLPTGVAGLVNPADGDPGRDLETDAAFRARHVDQINLGGKGTPQRIRAALLALGSDVVGYARVDENTESVVVDGRPPHSFEATVIGDGTDAQIGAVIFDQKPAGIRSYGSTTVTITDEVGETHDVEFSRGTERYLHLEITVTPGEGYPTTGDPLEAIQEAVVDYLDDALGLGQDFYRFSLGLPIAQAVPGIASVTIRADDTAAPGDVPTLTATDISVSSTTILRVSSNRVVVTT